MRVVIACDKFKGSVDAHGVAEALAAGLRRAAPQVDLDLMAAADGGEGTVDAALANGWTSVPVSVAGPLGTPVDAVVALHIPSGSALVEMAAASGLALLPRDAEGHLVRDALGATSRGTGDLLRAALEAGARRVVLAVGGSACTDGGAGMLAALGARLIDSSDEPLADGGGALTRLDRVDVSGLDPRLVDLDLTLAADVDNPLLGDRGAAAVFAPQKGASPDDVAFLEQALTRWRDRLADALGPGAAEAATSPGAGAAGGVGYAAIAALGARMRPGSEVVVDLIGLPQRVMGADLVITGEGSLDEQSLGGKTPMGVARVARAHGVPVVAVAGRNTLSDNAVRDAGFAAAYALSDIEPDVARCIADPAPLLERIGQQIVADHLQDMRA